MAGRESERKTSVEDTGKQWWWCLMFNCQKKKNQVLAKEDDFLWKKNFFQKLLEIEYLECAAITKLHRKVRMQNPKF